MVRASDFNGTLKRCEFEPRLHIFFHIFFFKFWIVIYSHNAILIVNDGSVELSFTLVCC